MLSIGAPTLMILPAEPRRFTVEEYLMIERAAEFKSEYIDGHIYAISGASLAHNRIAVNLAGELRSALRGGPCEVLQSDMRLQVADTGLYAYPDVMVACAPVEMADSHNDMLTNPVVIAEILSPSTMDYDRGLKFLRYQRLPPVHHYLLIRQDEVLVEHFRRQERGWILEALDHSEAWIELDAIGVRLRLADLYERVLPAA